MYNAIMPYNYTHALLGVASARLFQEDAQCIFDAYPDAFFIGTMGPDPYYADAMPRPLFRTCRAGLADMLHSTDGKQLFTALVEAAGDNRLRQAYALGFLCHFMLDYSVHPYVYAFFPGDAHTPGEIAMDALMVKRSGDSRFSVPPKAFWRTANLDGLDAYHADFIELLYGQHTRGVFARSLRKWLSVNTLSYDPSGRKYRFFQKASPHIAGFLQTPARADAEDALNLSHRPWPGHPDHPERTDSFVDLFEVAVSAAADCCNLFATAMCTHGHEALNHALDAVAGRDMDAT